MRFHNVIKKMAPTLCQKKQYTNGLIDTRINFEDRFGLDWAKNSPSYIKQATEIAEYHSGGTLFLVAEENIPAIKAAVHIINLWESNECEMDSEDDPTEYINFLQEKADIHFFDLQESAKNDEDLKKEFTLMLHLGEDSDSIFVGIPEGMKMRKILENIEACKSRNKLIIITPTQVKEKSVLDYRLREKAGIHVIEPLQADYYEKLVVKLLKAEKKKMPDVTPEQIVQGCRNIHGKNISEEFVAWVLDDGDNKARQVSYELGESLTERAAKVHKAIQGSTIRAADFTIIDIGKKDAIQSLNSMVGLENVKKIAYEQAALAKEKRKNRLMGTMHNNMIFAGNPGTGKTTVARYMAKILSENGICNNTCVVASRSSIVGKYVGHTSCLVDELFHGARGGVLFVDEAGFFLNTSSGGFVEEAIKEFVRYMEMYPDVTVIFAMYSKEVKAFLDLDDGLSSRISRIVNFRNYTKKELVQIAVKSFKDKGYKPEGACYGVIEKYIQNIKDNEHFGNAREMRKLVETAITAVSIRHFETNCEDNLVTSNDMEYAVNQLTAGVNYSGRQFGFVNYNQVKMEAQRW